ncbi:MAG: CdaR family protein, partial [Erysipelotrichaceae bacterium]|nr:CdaR family protein [Erysipelotrichaceae bacterium]
MTNFNRNNSQEQKDKTELANKIARQSKKVATTYEHIENGLFKIFRIFSSWIDHIIFKPRYTKIVSLAIAILLFITVNFNSTNSIFDQPLTSAREIRGMSVSAIYNSDVFEVSGIPQTANITVIGDSANVTTAVNIGGNVVVDLEGLTEGTHQVKLTTKGFNNNVNVKVEPTNAVVTLKKKTTREFDISYDFINMDKMDSIYSLGNPEFEYTKVNVRASKDTLDSIAFVKALIDVSGVNGDFSQVARLVAYDSNGQPINADIVPSEVNVTVPVSNPNKTVPIEVEVSGTVPNGMAIDSIDADQKTVTIYASDAVLSKIDKVIVKVDASTITQDTTLVRPITLPTGVNSSNVSQINLDVKLAEGVTKTVDNVAIYFKNNNNNYEFTPIDNKSTTSVNVFGTQKNVDAITADDISVYFDMT